MKIATLLIAFVVFIKSQIIEITTTNPPKEALKDFEFSVILFHDDSNYGVETKKIFNFAHKLFKKQNLGTRSVAWA